MSASWAIDMSTFSDDVKQHLIEWSQRAAVRTGFDEGRLIFVRKKKEKRTALYHNIRNLARAWGVNLPEGSDWLHEVDLVKAEEDNATPTSPEAAKETPTTPEKSESYTPDVYKSLLPANYGEMVRAMLCAKVAA